MKRAETGLFDHVQSLFHDHHGLCQHPDLYWTDLAKKSGSVANRQTAVAQETGTVSVDPVLVYPVFVVVVVVLLAE